jgi:ribose transport system substrate-binding protein
MDGYPVDGEGSGGSNGEGELLSGSNFDRRSLLIRGAGVVGALALGPVANAAAGTRLLSGLSASKQIAFEFPDTAFAGYPPQLKSIKQVAAKAGYSILESHANSQLSVEVSEIQTWISEGVAALIVLPLDDNAIGPLVQQAHQAGVKWIGYVDDLIPGIDGYVIFNNAHGGQVLGGYIGDWVNKKMHGKAKVALLTHNIQQNGRQRINGAVAAMKKKAPGAHVVAQHEGVLAAQTLPVAQSMLQAHPDINVFICFTDDGCLGVLNAFMQTHPSKARQAQMCITGFDGTMPAVQKIIAGTPIRATAATSIQTTSELCIQAALNAINGQGATKLTVPTVLCAQTPAGLRAARNLVRTTLPLLK